MDKKNLLSDVFQYLCEQESEANFIPGESVVPVSGATPTSEDILAVVDTVLDGWFTEKTRCQEFSLALKRFVQTRYCSLTNSGSSANLLAVTACSKHWYEGNYDERYKVITCATAFPTTIAPIIQNGLTPLFLDVDPYTLNPKLEDMLSALQDPHVAGIIQAHTLGFPFDAETIAKECNDRGKWFIEDCADALGAEIGDYRAGSFGNVSTLSMFPAHHITSMEGGALFTGNVEIYRLIESLRSWGRACSCVPGQDNRCGKRFDHKWKNMPDGYDHKYTFTEFGYNLHMTEPQAALGLSQMGRLPAIVFARRRNFEFLLENLQDFNDTLIFMQYNDGVLKASPFGFPVIVRKDAPFTKRELVAFLESRKIRTRPIFAGNITRQPMFDNLKYDVFTTLENSDLLMENGCWIGLHPELTQQMLEYVVETFYDFKDMKGF